MHIADATRRANRQRAAELKLDAQVEPLTFHNAELRIGTQVVPLSFDLQKQSWLEGWDFVTVRPWCRLRAGRDAFSLRQLFGR